SARGREWIDTGVKAQERAGRLVLPGSYAIGLPGRVIYRSHAGVRAIDPATRRELWAAASPLGLDAVATNSGKAVVVRNWMEAIYGDAFHFPIVNSALGRLSTDGHRVYAVEDLVVPPLAEVVQQVLGGVPVGGPFDRATLLSNRLRALDIDGGKVAWEIGGRGDLQNDFFLGAPLTVGGTLYALVEKQGEIRLVSVDPTSGAPLWSQRLGVTPSRLALDPGRRLRGVRMTFAGGLLLCPTDAGALFAFDPLTRSLAWVHLYPSKTPPPELGTAPLLAAFNVAWRESAPAVADGKVVFTPGDSDEVHCVGLGDGKPAWQAAKGDGIYLAGAFRGRALVVGPDGVRALSLKDGSEAWSRRVGVPSGQGAASDNVYYLPLKAARETGGPGVAALDVASGKVLAFAPSSGGEVPGNLTFFDSLVVSQTATTLTAYPQLKARLKRAEELLAGDPRNPRGLTERGTLRLYRGDVSGAMADLRAAVDVAPAGDVRREARGRLHDALRQAIQHDFAAGEKYLAEFEASCRVPVPEGATPESRALLDTERQRREANYLLVLARGRDGQGRIAEALAAYTRLYPRADRRLGTWRGPDVGWLAPSAPGAPAPDRPSRWVQGQVIGLVVGATGARQEAVRKEVARQWREMPPGANLDDLRRFVELFGTVAPVGPEARLAFGERLGRNHFLEAELHLLAVGRQREAPQVAARALEALAHLLTEKGLPDEALVYYRQLAEEFAAAPVRDGKTGSDFLKGLALDPRFVPLLDDPWEGRKFKTSEVRGLFLPPGNLMGMEPEGEAPPCLRRTRLALDTYGGRLKLFDRNTGAELWSQPVAIGGLRQALRAARADAWVPYRADGHLAVVQLGTFACGIDLHERRLLWARDLADKSTPVVQAALAQDAHGRAAIAYADGLSQPVARVSPIRAGTVCVCARGKLAALDPLRGDLLWTAPLDDPQAEPFADDTHAWLVEGQSQGAPALRRVVRLSDGAVKTLPPVRLLTDEPLQSAVGGLVIPPTAPERGHGRLTLYDPTSGKDLWSVPVAAGQHVARSEVPYLTATVARDGRLRVYDLRRREELFKADVDPDDLRGLTELRFFQDRWHYYLMMNRAVRARDGLTAAAMPNAVSGVRTLPAHGRLYAFRRNGSLHWASDVKGQHLILERLDESPLLLFSAVVQKTDPRSPAPVFTVAGIDKATGKALWPAREYSPITSPVHMVQINPATGTIDLVTRHWRMRYTVAE
ncbi:MAG TPA: PQQ-binding-like beta-propeller repeat protein, partial [Gemmataceae bacterium]|nr:PQQ-binding-like beta-propeller repeat protein [Gemmataceae bacterium]